MEGDTRRWKRGVAIALSLGAASMTAQSDPPSRPAALPKTFPVVEFRRYVIKPGGRQHFADYFESYFPEAFEQIGAIAFGQFLERGDPSRFTWIRGFHSIDDRAALNGAFYDGPLWKEHRTRMNDLILDSDDVLLLSPLNTDGAIPVLPAVDVVTEADGARGVVAAQIFPVKAGEVGAFARRAEPAFAACRAAGAREAGLLATLDVPNNFPRLPIRTDGPFLVWLAVLEGDAALEAFRPIAERSARELSSSGLLRAEPELIVLAPTRRSRLRWIPAGRGE